MRALLLSLALAVAMAATGADAGKFVSTASAPEPSIARFLVTLAETASPEDAARIASHYGVRIEPFAREGFSGFMIVATPRKARLLSTDERVALVEEQREERVHEAAAAQPSIVPSRIVANAGGTTRSLGVYAYDGVGNVSSITGDYGVEAFAYDELGRITGATLGAETARQDYRYDRYGNVTRITTAGIANPRRFGVATATNQMTLATDATGAAASAVGKYAPTGNLYEVQWTEPNQTMTFGYDGAGVLTDAAVFGDSRIYVYDANDERILTVDASGERWTLRGITGEVLRRFVRPPNAALQWTQDYVYRAKAMLAAFVPSAEKVVHFHVDHLGTPRLITGNGGALVGEHRYYPLGEELTPRDQDSEAKQFTGHERDRSPLSPLGDVDYMHARHYVPSLARFASMDPGKDWDPAAPQSWNLYTYARNNGLRYADPDGRRVVVVCVGNDCTASVRAQLVVDPTFPEILTALAFKTAGESYWNSRTVTAGARTLRFNVQLDLVASGQQNATMDQIDVVDAVGRAHINHPSHTVGGGNNHDRIQPPDRGEIFTGDITHNPSGMAGIAPHEIGHMMGLPELSGGTVAQFINAPTHSIMEMAQPNNSPDIASFVFSAANWESFIVWWPFGF